MPTQQNDLPKKCPFRDAREQQCLQVIFPLRPWWVQAALRSYPKETRGTWVLPVLYINMGLITSKEKSGFMPLDMFGGLLLYQMLKHKRLSLFLELSLLSWIKFRKWSHRDWSLLTTKLYPMNFKHWAGYTDWGAVNRWETRDSGLSVLHTDPMEVQSFWGSWK